MTRPRQHDPATTRLALDAKVVAEVVFGKGETWFREKLPQLYESGFPRYDDLIDGWNICQIVAWFEGRTITDGAAERDEGIQHRLEAMQNGQL